MKIFRAILLLLIIVNFNASAQIAINFNVKRAEKDCSSDTVTRLATGYYINGDQKVKLTSFKFKGCKYTYLKQIPKGKYLVEIEAAGYTSQKTFIEIKDEKTINVEPIVLAEEILLKQVEIKIAKEYIRNEGDKTTVIIKGNELLSGGNVQEAISKLPGVLSNLSGDIMLNGKPTAIWIDGSPSNLSGQNLTSLLQSLPANSIDKIELITNPGASFDANSSSGGILNIVTYSGGFRSLNGSMSSSYSYNKYHKTNQSLFLNGRNKKLNWQILTSFGYTESATSTLLDVNVAKDNKEETLNSVSSLENKNSSIAFRPAIRYTLSKRSSIKLNYNLNINDAQPFTLGKLERGNLSYNTDFDEEQKSNRHELIAGYSLKLDSFDRKLDMTLYGMNFDQNRSSNSIQRLNQPLYSYSKNNLAIQNLYLKGDLSLPLPNKNILNVGLKIFNSDVKSEGLYGRSNTKILVTDNPEFSSMIPFRYTDNGQSLYAELRKSSEKFKLSLGARIERYRFKSEVINSATLISESYVNLFPSISFLYNVTPSISLSTNYSRKIGQVGYSELDPNINGFFDNFSQNIGNPTLKPIFFNNYEIKLNAFGYAGLNFNYSTSKSRNLQFYGYDYDADKIIQTYQSFDNSVTYGISANLPIPFKLFTEGMSFFSKPVDPDKENFIYLNAGFVNYNFDQTTTLIQSKGNIWYYGAYSQIMLPVKTKLLIYYSFSGKGTYELYSITNPIKSVDVTLSRAFLKKKLKLDFIIYDVFNTKSTNANLRNSNLNLGYYQKYDSRNFRLTLFYSFGKSNNSRNLDFNKEEDRLESKNTISPKL